MTEFKNGDKVKVISTTKSDLPSDSIGWVGIVQNNNHDLYCRIWVNFPTGYNHRDEIWYVHPDDIELW